MNQSDTQGWIRVVLVIALLIVAVTSGIVQGGKAPTDDATKTEHNTSASSTVCTNEPTRETMAATETAANSPTQVETPPETEPPTAATETPPETTAPMETEPPYTNQDLELLALVIYQEAGGDAYSDETRLMVGTVVMNRVASDLYPDTIFEVITQENQYGRLHWTGPVWPNRASQEVEAHAVERAYAIAERILLGEKALPEDVIFQAEFVQGSEVVAFEDGIYFCR